MRLILALLALALAAQANPFYPFAATIVQRMVTCNFSSTGGVFQGEGLWQSGNTLETLSNFLIQSRSKEQAYLDVLESAYFRLPIIVDQCNDDHQWYLLAWVRAFEATNNSLYLERAAQIFDFVAQIGWTPSCGGGIVWCNSGNYKNAITSELFLTSAMRLHQYEQQLSKPANYYLSWAQRTWAWLEASGMINSQWLINDGLGDNCKNNQATTWTYNQGVLLDGLGRLSAATSNTTLLKVAYNIANATMTLLAPNGILQEPCTGKCDGDQHLFKGIFARHLAYFASANPFPQADSFLVKNAQSVMTRDTCAYQSFGLLWGGPCLPDDSLIASTSSALDLLLAATPLSNASVPWQVLGLGNCEDDFGDPMSNCGAENIPPAECVAYALSTEGAVAFDLQSDCTGGTFCRIRTLQAGPGVCPQNWGYEIGIATTVTRSTGSSMTVCVRK